MYLIFWGVRIKAVKNMNINEINDLFDVMVENVKYIKRTTYGKCK